MILTGKIRSTRIGTHTTVSTTIDELNTSKEQWWDDIDRENPK